jgi:citrate synthase
MPLKSYGLEGVVAAESELSCIDGEKGILEYRGYDVHKLAKNSSFEEVAFLLWYGYLPKKKEFEKFKNDLRNRREVPEEIVELLKLLPSTTHPMIALRTAISFLSSFDERLEDYSEERNMERSKRLLAVFPTIVAYFDRIRNGKEVIPPDPHLNHTANFLYMLRGERAGEIETRVLDLDFLLHAEHTMNASTFTARISASTLADMYSGIVAAIATLMGPLHGGASQKVMEMLLEIGEVDNVEGYVKRALAAGERIMGFGHRVYKVMDPRAIELRKLAQELGEYTGDLTWYEISEKLREVVYREKGLHPNVDFYSASIYANLGIPVDMFVCMFAIARVAGWTAHMIEQYRDNRLIRPLQRYVGRKNLKYIPLEDR